LVYLLALLFPDSYTILFREIYFLPFSVHAQANITLLEGHSEIKPRIDDTLEGVVKASHLREQTLIKNPGPSGWRFYNELTRHLSKKIHGHKFLAGAIDYIRI
jgi:hypothetical protein